MTAKSVRFNPVSTIHMTYSADEYDRSCFAFASYPKHYIFFRPKIATRTSEQANNHSTQTTTAQDTKPAVTSLDLSVIPNSRRRMLDSPTEKTQTPSPVPFGKRCKKPKLTINTQSLTPLIFTELTTHYKCKNEEEDEEHGYLIPISAC